MKFEQTPIQPEVPSEKPRGGILKKAAMVLGMVGAMGALEGSAEAKGNKEAGTEHERVLEKMKLEADARWAARMDVDPASGKEGRVPGDKTVLSYRGVEKKDPNSSVDPKKAIGLTLIDEGRIDVKGDERWLDLVVHWSEEGRAYVTGSFESTAKNSTAGILFDSPFFLEAYTVMEKGESTVPYSSDSRVNRDNHLQGQAGIASRWYWGAYAMQVLGEGGLARRKKLEKRPGVFRKQFPGRVHAPLRSWRSGVCVRQEPYRDRRRLDSEDEVGRLPEKADQVKTLVNVGPLRRKLLYFLAY